MSTSYTLASALDRLPDRRAEQRSPVEKPAATAAAKPQAQAVNASGSPGTSNFSALLSRLAAEGGDAPAATEAATPVVKPNLDALNRVLSHYAAQNAAMDSIVSLVKR